MERLRFNCYPVAPLSADAIDCPNIGIMVTVTGNGCQTGCLSTFPSIEKVTSYDNQDC